jgi:hypothetical protein
MRIVVLLIALLFSLPATARDNQMYGSVNTGAPFRYECPEGHFVVGFSGHTGAWVDSITGIWCAQVRPRVKGIQPLWMISHNPRMLQVLIGTSTGGSPKVTKCDRYDRAVQRLRIGMIRVDEVNTSVVNSIDFSCRSIRTTDKKYISKNIRYFGQLDGGGPAYAGFCYDSELLAGLYGRSGLYIDAVGLICKERSRNPAPEL